MRYLLSKILIVLFLVQIFCAVSSGQEPLPSAQDKLDKAKAILLQKDQPNAGVPTPSANIAYDESLSASGIKVFENLFALLGIVLIGAWVYKKYILKEHITASKRIRIIEHIPLLTRANLTLVEVGGEKILVAQQQGAISMISLGKKEAFDLTLSEELSDE